MKKLHFDYCMQISYSSRVDRCHYTMKCIPVDSDRQHLENWHIAFTPENPWMRGEDSFGNQTIYGSVDDPHDQFNVQIVGEVTTGLADYETDRQASRIGMFRYPYGLTKAGDRIRTYHRDLELDSNASAFDRGFIMMQQLYHDFIYEKKVTDVNTSAEEALTLGKGVCQDYAHILIALCHLEQIPARYVAGMMIGEGASHAWVEIYHEGGWYALDPTNNQVVDDNYIKLGIGRDASDCLINRGLILGGGEQLQTIWVNVIEK